jgi:hypothetical protein
MTISPDGNFMYFKYFASVTKYSLNKSIGTLTYVDNTSIGKDFTNMSISPDGNYMYFAYYNSTNLTEYVMGYSRNNGTGVLAYANSTSLASGIALSDVIPSSTDGTGVGIVNMAASPDNNFIYFTTTYNPHNVRMWSISYSRNSSTGIPAYSSNCAVSNGSKTNTQLMTISPDGNFAYFTVHGTTYGSDEYVIKYSRS